jgi:ferredoxin--NADP+ reductase
LCDAASAQTVRLANPLRRNGKAKRVSWRVSISTAVDFNHQIVFTMSAFNEERVLSVHHWTDRLFTFTTTRDKALRFSNGHFTMIGLRVNDKPLLRAYSIVSPNHEEHLEFLSIKVAEGPLTSRLQHIQVGDTIIVGRKPTGTLVIDYLLPGKRLYLLSTGTGLAPFMSIIRDPATYEQFEQIVLVHGVRQAEELAYHDLVVEHLPQHEFLGDLISKQLLYYPTVTREAYRNMGRVTDLMESGKMFADLQLPALDPAHDRVMICGSPAMLKDLKHLLEKTGFKEGNTSKPGDFVIERAFAEQ